MFKAAARSEVASASYTDSSVLSGGYNGKPCNWPKQIRNDLNIYPRSPALVQMFLHAFEYSSCNVLSMCYIH